MFTGALGEIACVGLVPVIGVPGWIGTPMLARLGSVDLAQELRALGIARAWNKQSRPTPVVPTCAPPLRIDLIEHGDAEITVGEQAFRTRVFGPGYARSLDLRCDKFAELLAPHVDDPAL